MSTLLSRQQNCVAGLVAEGLSNKEIADRLQRSEHTVKNHLRIIFAKVGARSRTALGVRFMTAAAAR